METSATSLYRKLPQLGELLDQPACQELRRRYSVRLVTDVARAELVRIRAELKAGTCSKEMLLALIANLPASIGDALNRRLRPSLRRVINATGVILQTNLGRAPLSEAAIEHMAEIARGYCNIELDLNTGERTRRDEHVENLILDVLEFRAGLPSGTLTQTHAAAVVNNCAAAAFLALNSLAEGGEVIVSRGELVEIGGGFRVPEILAKSGAVLREVGTTNRTRLADYASAITPETRLILRVHQSNFRIEGFTARPSLNDLAELGKERSIPVFEDQGTGCVVNLRGCGIAEESSWVASVASGVSLVACSGDKLLGGPQCGLLVGKREVVEKLRLNPLARALRVDKLIYAALEATLLAYLSGGEQSIPSIGMLHIHKEVLERRCQMLVESIGSEEISAEVVPVCSVVGGGTTPGASLPGFAVALRHTGMNEGIFAARLRRLDPPVIARTGEGRVILDLRTVKVEEDEDLARMLRQVLNG
jgi:L-seryl-tRNA(Ser) seleniumtransferase